MAADRIGAGSNATVFRAWDRHLERDVAFKVSIGDVVVEELGAQRLAELGIAEGLRRYIDEHEADARKRYTLLREARLLARVRHPNVVQILDIGVLDDGALAVAMPLFEAGALDEQELAGPWEDVLDLALQIGRGLAAIHEAGILHRDFKPNNILFDRQRRPHIADLGLGCLVDDAEALADWVGTPEYMAPEVLLQQSRDVRDDLYAYCMVVYRMFYGHAPFASVEARRQGRVLAGVREGGMPAKLHAILVRGLSPDLDARWSDMGTLLQELEAVRRPRRRWPWLAAAGVVAALTGGLFALSGPVQAGACKDLGDELADSWSEDIAAELRGVMGTRAGSEALESWMARWAAVRAQECKQAELVGMSTDASPCMVTSRERFRSTVVTLRKPHLRHGLRYAKVIAELPAPEYCLDHPDDRTHGYGGLPLLRDLDAELAQLTILGELELAATRQLDYLEQARAQSSTYDIARAIYWRGELHRLAGEHDDAEHDFGLAHADAKAIGAEEFVAESLMKLAQVAAARGEVSAVDAYARSAREGLALVNPDRIPELLQVQGLGLLEGAPDDARRGVGLLREAVALREQQYRRYGGSRELISQSLEALARGLLEIGEHDEALELAGRSLELHEESFNVRTPRADDLVRLLVVIELAMGRTSEADARMRDLVTLQFLDQQTESYLANVEWFIAQAKEHGAQLVAREWEVTMRRDAGALSSKGADGGP